VSAGPGALDALARRLGYADGPSDLLRQALTHRSYANEHPPAASNEGLAFLGDAVLGLAVAHALYGAKPGAGPGLLTAWRAEIVSARGLARWARELGVDRALRLGRGEEGGGGRDKDSVLASALEAVAGALYLDGGLPRVEAALGPLIPVE
jgi:ribonuclease-3